ncbi:lovastatin nonaketide synthase [Penicillium lividum]|nr:lovastatin nonaketide synthase [Penicillium lividum]
MKNHPPVAGVANAAMVLQDSLFTNTSIDMLNKVLSPKVDGSSYLDELFSDPGLDFFILFSSFGLITGNGGQTSYNAANSYLTALAAQRRSRGLSASVMDLGPILGLGYITRSHLFSGDHIDDIGAYPISESDFLEHFAEAVLASPIGKDSYEIISGLRGVDPSIDSQVTWIHNPRMSHLLLNSGIAGVDHDEKRSVSIKERLLDATGLEQVQGVILDAFTRRLSVLLQLSMDSIDIDTPLVDIGVDSLVALDIRSWFLKSIDVEIPVINILSGSTISEIANHAAQNLPARVQVQPLAQISTSVHSENESSGVSDNLSHDSLSTEHITLSDDKIILTPPLDPSLVEGGFSPDYFDHKSPRLLDAPVEGNFDGNSPWS